MTGFGSYIGTIPVTVGGEKYAKYLVNSGLPIVVYSDNTWCAPTFWRALLDDHLKIKKENIKLKQEVEELKKAMAPKPRKFKNLSEIRQKELTALVENTCPDGSWVRLPVESEDEGEKISAHLNTGFLRTLDRSSTQRHVQPTVAGGWELKFKLWLLHTRNKKTTAS